MFFHPINLKTKRKKNTTQTMIKYFTAAIIDPTYNTLWMQEDKLVFRVLGIYNFEIRDNVSETVPLHRGSMGVG